MATEVRRHGALRRPRRVRRRKRLCDWRRRRLVPPAERGRVHRGAMVPTAWFAGSAAAALAFLELSGKFQLNLF